MSKYKVRDKVRPVNWTPQLVATVIETTEHGVKVEFDPAGTGGVPGLTFHFVDECVEPAEIDHAL